MTKDRTERILAELRARPHDPERSLQEKAELMGQVADLTHDLDRARDVARWLYRNGGRGLLDLSGGDTSEWWWIADLPEAHVVAVSAATERPDSLEMDAADQRRRDVIAQSWGGVCRTCVGTGVTHDRDSEVVCAACGGSGHADDEEPPVANDGFGGLARLAADLGVAEEVLATYIRRDDQLHRALDRLTARLGQLEHENQQLREHLQHERRARDEARELVRVAMQFGTADFSPGHDRYPWAYPHLPAPEEQQ